MFYVNIKTGVYCKEDLFDEDTVVINDDIIFAGQYVINDNQVVKNTTALAGVKHSIMHFEI